MVALSNWEASASLVVAARAIAFESDFSDTFTGSITPGRDYIIYAAADTKIDMHPQTTISEFAQKNRGNYLVVTAHLN